MTSVAAARRIAADWVDEHGSRLDGFRGAFLTGSVIPATDDAVLPPSSDVDVMLVIDGPATGIGKFEREGVLIEASAMPLTALRDAAAVERTHYLAPSFTGGQILADPTGGLRRLEQRIAPRFTDPSAVRARCTDVSQRIHRQLDGFDPDRSWAQLVTGVVFPASLPTVLLAVAAGRAPTVRRRYLVCREAVAGTAVADVYPGLLDLAGCGDVTAAVVSRQLDVLAEMFDEAASVARTPLFFSADITPAARSVALGGSRELVDTGNHHEAVFWVVATFARCQQILDADATDPSAARWRERFRDATAELVGLATAEDVLRRRDEVRAAVPAVSAAAERLIAGRRRPVG